MSEVPEIIGQKLSISDGPLLFVADARNSLERNLLEDWIRSTVGNEDAEPRWVALTISRKIAASSVSELAEHLGLPDETRIAPIRVTWPLPIGRENKPMGIRSLLFGDRRRPSWIRAYFTLRRDKSRAKVLVGEPATICELRRRFTQYHTTDGEITASSFAAYVIRQASVALDICERRLHGSRYKVPRFVADSLFKWTVPEFRTFK